MTSVCPNNLVYENGLCYTPCQSGYKGVGHACVANCPPNTKDLGSTMCQKDTYVRGPGVAPTNCPLGQANIAGTCYPNCPNNYVGVDTVCWGACPKYFTDNGLSCQKPPSYGRGVGHVTQQQCEQSGDRAKTNGCEHYLGLWYPKCDPNFRSVGCCVCAPFCPAGFHDNGSECTKPSIARSGTPSTTCNTGFELDSGLCYPACKPGFKATGTMCAAVCNDLTQDTGLDCFKKSYQRSPGIPPSSPSTPSTPSVPVSPSITPAPYTPPSSISFAPLTLSPSGGSIAWSNPIQPTLDSTVSSASAMPEGVIRIGPNNIGFGAIETYTADLDNAPDYPAPVTTSNWNFWIILIIVLVVLYLIFFNKKELF